MKPNLKASCDRLLSRIEQLATIGSIDGGGVCRLALTEEDRLARDLVTRWMTELGLVVSIDQIGNVIGTRLGAVDGPPVMIGSHIDSVATGGRYDGSLGVLAGLELIETLNEANFQTHHPLAVAFFTNEEGARFAPDMMGSAVHQGSLSLNKALATKDENDASVGAELKRIGYAGDDAVAAVTPRAFLELHVEQGPVLEEAGTTIGIVTGVQGISWTEYRVTGTSNHAGTTPMRLRHDAGFVAAAITTEARHLAHQLGDDQVATVGVTELRPNLVNVIANQARITVDLRNTIEETLQRAEASMAQYIAKLAAIEGVEVASRSLARFCPVEFNPEVVNLIETTANDRGYACQRLPSGAGHDAQMFAPNCPTGMIFVPSQGGISHNVREFTAATEIDAGLDVLTQVALQLTE
ncbi:MAG: Zn-dependent hydrolase [Pseudomonadota bacterium]|nr:Zn-dependent hydrolase [Pseudomonadota bacterium]